MRASRVFPEPVGPISRTFDLSIVGNMVGLAAVDPTPESIPDANLLSKSDIKPGPPLPPELGFTQPRLIGTTGTVATCQRARFYQATHNLRLAQGNQSAQDEEALRDSVWMTALASSALHASRLSLP